MYIVLRQPGATARSDSQERPQQRRGRTAQRRDAQTSSPNLFPPNKKKTSLVSKKEIGVTWRYVGIYIHIYICPGIYVYIHREREGERNFLSIEL